MAASATSIESEEPASFSEDTLLEMAAAAATETPPPPPAKVEVAEEGEDSSTKGMKPAFFKMMLNDDDEGGTSKVHEKEEPGMAEHFAAFAAGAATEVPAVEEDSNNPGGTVGDGKVDPDLAALMGNFAGGEGSDDESGERHKGRSQDGP